MTSAACVLSSEPTPVARSRAWAIGETAAIFVVFCLFAATPAPAVNEAHYLAKAKHYWNPEWCRGDLFLESADAHLVFYWTIGWLTRGLPLAAVAWVGRIVTWGLLAWSWQRLSFAALPRNGYAILSSLLMLLFVQRFHMAGEWIVGGVEAKGFAFVLVFLGLEAMLRQRWRAALLMLGAATSFHVLVGGWSLVAAGAAWLSCGRLRPSAVSLVPAVLGAIGLALAGLIPAITLTLGVDPSVVREANRIYVFERLSHHLVFFRFMDSELLPYGNLLRHAALLGVWLVCGWLTPCRMSPMNLGQRPLRGFVGGAVAIAVVGILIDQALLLRQDLAAKLLRYYWFRLSDAFLPVGGAIAICGTAASWLTLRPRAARWLLFGATAAGTLNLAVAATQRVADFRRGASWETVAIEGKLRHNAHDLFRDWQRMCAWVAQNTPAETRLLTPRHQQTFKWFAERSEVVTWKDVPQDAASVVAWWQSFDEVFPQEFESAGLAAQGETRLRELGRKYSASYVVVDRWRSAAPLGFRRVYPTAMDANASFEVYVLE